MFDREITLCRAVVKDPSSMMTTGPSVPRQSGHTAINLMENKMNVAVKSHEMVDAEPAKVSVTADTNRQNRVCASPELAALIIEHARIDVQFGNVPCVEAEQTLNAQQEALFDLIEKTDFITPEDQRHKAAFLLGSRYAGTRLPVNRLGYTEEFLKQADALFSVAQATSMADSDCMTAVEIDARVHFVHQHHNLTSYSEDDLWLQSRGLDWDAFEKWVSAYGCIANPLLHRFETRKPSTLTALIGLHSEQAKAINRSGSDDELDGTVDAAVKTEDHIASLSAITNGELIEKAEFLLKLHRQDKAASERWIELFLLSIIKPDGVGHD